MSDASGKRRQPTPNQSNLGLVDTRIRGLKIHSPQSPELDRMKAARAEIVGRMTKDELAAYDKAVNAAKSDEQLRAEAEAERIAMEANKDRPPI